MKVISHVVLVLCLPVTLSAAPTDYLVVFRDFGQEWVDGYLQREVGRALTRADERILAELQFGLLEMFLITAHNDSVSRLLQNTEIVDFVEPDEHWFIPPQSDIRDVCPAETHTVRQDTWGRHVTTVTPDVTTVSEQQCLTQQSADTLWGLSRISYRHKPDLTRARYTYAETPHISDAIIYVVDSGCQVTHSDLRGRLRWGYTVRRLRSVAEEGDRDTHGHGTHVTGTVAGTRYGAAKNATVVVVKVFGAAGRAFTSDIIEGLQWVRADYLQQRGRRATCSGVVNLSLGSYVTGERPTAMEKVVQDLMKVGLTVVAAAGNNYRDACQISPGRMRDVITVGATTAADELAGFSNYGRCVDLLAPGDSILSAAANGGAVRMRGTSMSTPHVTGVIAQLLGARGRQWDPLRVKYELLSRVTVNKLRLRSNEQATPNKLLFSACGSGGEEPPVSGGHMGAHNNHRRLHTTVLIILLSRLTSVMVNKL